MLIGRHYEFAFEHMGTSSSVAALSILLFNFHVVLVAIIIFGTSSTHQRITITFDYWLSPFYGRAVPVIIQVGSPYATICGGRHLEAYLTKK